ncbi:MAG: bla [Bacteroidetes bacterium]|jgi:metallo-beta-lactamase class B|nr:bla [Bacteroidota bacterium]MDF2450653.1 bla [Bacteroidota bacterium]
MKAIHFLITLLFSISLFAQTPGLKISHLTGDFYVYTTYKAYKGTPVSANGSYVVTNKGVIIIDTPWDTIQFQPLLDSIENRHRQKVVLCIATHSHEDRSAGLEYYKQKGIKTYTSKQTDVISEKTGEKRAEFLFSKDTTFTLGQYSFETYYPGEGHTKDNIVIWFPKEKILHGGCAIKSMEAADLGYVKEANLSEWPKSLNRIKKHCASPKFIIPGHQSWRSLKSIDHTLKLLKEHK